MGIVRVVPKAAAVVAVAVFISSCSSDYQPKSAADAAQKFFGDRLIEYHEAAGNVYVKFKAQGSMSPELTRKSILNDARSYLRKVYSLPEHLQPVQVTFEATLQARSAGGETSDTTVGLIVYENEAPVAWENVHTLRQFEQLLSVAHFPFS